MYLTCIRVYVLKPIQKSLLTDYNQKENKCTDMGRKSPQYNTHNI